MKMHKPTVNQEDRIYLCQGDIKILIFTLTTSTITCILTKVNPVTTLSSNNLIVGLGLVLSKKTVSGTMLTTVQVRYL